MSDLPIPKTITAKDTKRPFHDPNNIPEARHLTSEDTKKSGSSFHSRYRDDSIHQHNQERQNIRSRKRDYSTAKKLVRYSPNVRSSAVGSRSPSHSTDIIKRIDRLNHSYNNLRSSNLSLNSVFNNPLHRKMPNLSSCKMPSYKSNAKLGSLKMPNMKFKNKFKFKL